MARIKSFGAEVYINGVAIGGLTDIAASGTDVSFVDTTSHDTGGGFKTFLAGLKDGGTLELTGKYNYADAGQAEWKGEEGVSHAFYIILSDNSGFAFTAMVGGFQTSNPLDDAVEFSATAKITGQVYPMFPTISVDGVLTSNGAAAVTFDDLTPYGITNGRWLYYDVGEDVSISWNLSAWEMLHGASGALWTSTANVPAPDLVTSIYSGPWHATTNPNGWKPTAPATGTPEVTGS